jgi:hypothetical protein
VFAAVGYFGDSWLVLSLAAMALAWLTAELHDLWLGRRLAALANSRPDKSLDAFLGSFRRGDVDRALARSVYEVLLALPRGYEGKFPLRASDRLAQDLRVDRKALEDYVEDILVRAKRTAEPELSIDPRKVKTVEQLVEALQAGTT